MASKEDRIWLQETWVDKTANFIAGDSDVYESWATFANIGRLFRNLQREYGRCISSMYIDTPRGPQRIGWVFLKKAHYTDTGEPYLQETWVSLHTAPPTRKTYYQYAHL